MFVAAGVFEHGFKCLLPERAHPGFISLPVTVISRLLPIQVLPVRPAELRNAERVLTAMAENERVVKSEKRLPCFLSAPLLVRDDC